MSCRRSRSRSIRLIKGLNTSSRPVRWPINALLLLRAWAEEQHGPLQEQLDKAVLASHDALWETAAKEQPPWWALA